MKYKIGVLDSGIGGFFVLKTLIDEMPENEYVLYIDNANVPYGDKCKAEIFNLTKSAVEKLIALNVDMVVLGCNTATAVAIKELRNIFSIPIFGTEPAIKCALSSGENETILVLATKATFDYCEILNSYKSESIVKVFIPNLPSVIDQNLFNKKEILKFMDGKLPSLPFRKIVLGCTHFEAIKDILIKKYGNVMFYDGKKGLAKHIKNVIGSETIKLTSDAKKTPPSVYFSGEENFEMIKFFMKIR